MNNEHARRPPPPDVEELVREAAEDAPLIRAWAAYENAARLFWSMLNVSGTIDWRRGWPEAVADAFERAGLARPSLKVLRWHKCRMAKDPTVYAAYSPDPALVEDLLARRASDRASA